MDSTPPPPNHLRFRNGLILIVILLLATWLRLLSIGTRSFWVDEGVSLAIARLSWRDFFALLWRRELNMSLYYFLLRGWIHLGTTEAAVRAFSAAASVFAVAALYFLGKHLFGRNVGFLAAILLALNSYHVAYAQEARGYALLSLAAIISTYLLVRAIESSSSFSWTIYALSCACAIYIHFFALLVVAAHLLSLVLWLRPIPWRKIILTKALLAAMLLPIAFFLLHLGNSNQLDWIPAPTFSALRAFAIDFTGRGGPILLAAYVFFIVLAFAFPLRESREQVLSSPNFSLGIAALWTFLPIALMLAISLVKPIFVPRYMAMSLPAFALLAARGLAVLRPKWQAAALIIVAALALYGVRDYDRQLPQSLEDWRSAGQLYVENARPGDAVILSNGITRPVFDYYATQDMKLHLSNVIVSPSHTEQLTFRDFEGLPNAQMVAGRTRDVQRLWAVDWIASPPVDPLLEPAFAKVESRRFSDITVSLYVRRPAK